MYNGSSRFSLPSTSAVNKSGIDSLNGVKRVEIDLSGADSKITEQNLKKL
jgi:hypothetical protein